MLSLSDNEFAVISFLTRNFSERLTIRNMAKKLSFSPAGVFNILKKLEREKIVYGERLGSGLFYSMNFESKIAEHLCEIALVYPQEKIDEKLLLFAKKCVAAIYDKKTLLVVIDGMTLDVPEGLSVISKTEEELILSFRKKDPEVMQVLKKGIVVWNETKFVDMIKNSFSRF